MSAPCHSGEGQNPVFSLVSGLYTKFGKTNPILKSLTYYTERTNLKNTKSKQTQTNPLSHLWITFPVRWTLRNWRGIGGVGGFADDEDFVLAGLLSPQHGMVGLFPQPGFIVAVVGKRRQPAADGQASLAGIAE